MIHWTQVVFWVVLTTLVYFTFKNYDSGGSGYGPDLGGFVNIFFFIVMIAFILIWGGIFWW